MLRWCRYLVLFLASATLGLALGRAPWAELRWKLAGPDLAWPTVEAYDFHFDLSQPGHFAARVQVELSGVESPQTTLLLNEDLEISSATAAGEPIAFTHYWSLPSRFHREGRVVQFTLPEAPADGRVSLALEYAGDAAMGRKGSDWRGILFVDVDETRMCEQTIFYPQVPIAIHGGAVAKAPYAMTLVAPEAWEIFVPAPGGVSVEDVRAQGEKTRTWTFRAEHARHPSILGGLLKRAQAEVNGSQIVTLLREEHAQLAPGFVEESRLAIEDYTRRFGPIDAGVIGVVEIHCRDSSYNWAAEGVMAFDRGALSGSVPVAKVAHEVAHLWWGQRVDAFGTAERFLTEGLAEFSAWSYLLDTGRGDTVERQMRAAQRSAAELAKEGDSLALAEVTFGVPNYNALAYKKGPLVLRNLQAQLPAGVLDQALRQLVDLGTQRPVSLDDFYAAVRGASERSTLQIPWIEAPGDLELSLGDVQVVDGRLQCAIETRPVPSGASLPIAGTPIAMELGGVGWRERRYLALDGPRTELNENLGGRDLRYMRLDPESAWPTSVENGFVVFNGAQIASAEPALGASAEFGGTQLRLHFDRPLTPIDLAELQRGQGASRPPGTTRFGLVGVSLAQGNRTLVIETDPWLPEKRYSLSLASVRDADGVPVAQTPYELPIEPSADEQNARIVSTIPATGAEVHAPGGRLDIGLTFDECMHHGQAITTSGVRDVESRGYIYPKLDGFGRWQADQRTILWTCKNLEAGKTYALPIRKRSFHDLSGNGCEELDLIFTVASTD